MAEIVTAPEPENTLHELPAPEAVIAGSVALPDPLKSAALDGVIDPAPLAVMAGREGVLTVPHNHWYGHGLRNGHEYPSATDRPDPVWVVVTVPEVPAPLAVSGANDGVPAPENVEWNSTAPLAVSGAREAAPDPVYVMGPVTVMAWVFEVIDLELFVTRMLYEPGVFVSTVTEESPVDVVLAIGFVLAVESPPVPVSAVQLPVPWSHSKVRS
jgi:hypothetical protein